MRVLLDTNVVLDVLLNRAPWVVDAAATWDAHRAGRITAYLAAYTVPTVFYVIRQQNDLAAAHNAVRACLESLEILPVSRSTLQLAQRQAASDYEDNLQIASAIEGTLDAIVTRDPSGFAHSPVRVLTPAELLTQLGATQSGPAFLEPREPNGEETQA